MSKTLRSLAIVSPGVALSCRDAGGGTLSQGLFMGLLNGPRILVHSSCRRNIVKYFTFPPGEEEA